MNNLAIYLTDLHINKYQQFSDKADRLENCLVVIDDVYRLAAKKGIKTILFSGDMFDTVKYLFTLVVNETTARFRRWVDEYPDVTWYAITGNHDFGTKNLPHKPAVSALRYLSEAFPKQFWVIDNNLVNINGSWIAGIPNYEYPEHYQEQLRRMSEGIGKKSKVTLLIHQKPPLIDNPAIRPDTDPHDPLYDNFDLVLCGDIHASQWITDKFLLGGNPLHRDLNDAGKEKGIWVIDLANPCRETTKFVSRKGRYPEFRKARPQDIPEETTDFIVPVEEITEVKTEGLADPDKFAASIPKQDLVRNFLEEKGKNEPELLAKGMAFIS